VDLQRSKWWEAGKDCIMRSFVSCMIYQTLLCGKIKVDEMGGTCNTHEKQGICTDIGCSQYLG